MSGVYEPNRGGARSASPRTAGLRRSLVPIPAVAPVEPDPRGGPAPVWGSVGEDGCGLEGDAFDEFGFVAVGADGYLANEGDAVEDSLHVKLAEVLGA